jgi:ketosteroid isomerase-like protein
MTEFVVADSGIRQLHARYVDAVWRKDFNAFADCFAENAEWKIAAMHMHGRAQIGSLIARLLSGCERVLMILGTPILEVGQGTAAGRILATEFVQLKDGTSAMTIGVYYDRYVDEGDRWRFQWRHWGLHYRGPADLSAAFVDCPEYGPHPGMPGPDEPTITRRKLD